MSGAPPDVQVTSLGSTTIHTLPSCNSAGVSDTVAFPFQGVTGGVPVPVLQVNTPTLPAGAAGDGTDGTGITPPTGAVGIRGWLSGCYSVLGNIYSKLITSVAVTGTFYPATQAISSAINSFVDGAIVTLGSITDAAWSGSGNGTLNAVNKAIYGKLAAAGTTMLSPASALTVTFNGAYAAGDIVGQKMQFTRASNGGTLMSATVMSKSILATTLKLHIFTTNPTNTTWTDNAVPAIVAADVPFELSAIPLNAPDSSLGTHTVWSTGGLGLQFLASNLYGVLITTSAITLTSSTTGDISVQIGISEDK